MSRFNGHMGLVWECVEWFWFRSKPPPVEQRVQEINVVARRFALAETEHVDRRRAHRNGGSNKSREEVPVHTAEQNQNQAD